MLQKEFEERTGFRPSVDYYHEVIEPEYMRSNLDKDAFCKQWKKQGGIQKAYDALKEQDANEYANVLSLENENESFANEISSLKADLKDLSESYNALLNERKESIEDKMNMMEALIEISETYSSSELRQLVIDNIGFKAYITYKLINKKAIWKIDADAIIENMQ